MATRSQLIRRTLPSAFLLCALTAASAQAANESDKKPDSKPETSAAPAKSAVYHTDASGRTVGMPPYYPKSVHTRAEAADYDQTYGQVYTFPLHNAAQANDGNEILTGLRLMLEPSIKLYLIPAQNLIAIRLIPEEVPAVEKLLAAWDRPHPSYRLLYTITESDAGKRIGVQHFSLAVVSGQRTTMKNGSKIPVATGSYSTGGKDSSTAAGVQTQFTYLDVGVNIDVTLSEDAGGGQLKSKVEQSSVVEDKSISGVNEPIIRQNVVEGVTQLTLGKPLLVGGIDIVGSTRHMDVEVTMEPLK